MCVCGVCVCRCDQDLSSVFKKVLQVDGTKDVDELKKDIEAFLA